MFTLDYYFRGMRKIMFFIIWPLVFAVFWGLVHFQCALHSLSNTCQTSWCGCDLWPQWPCTPLLTPSFQTSVSVSVQVCGLKQDAWRKKTLLFLQGVSFKSLTSRSASGHEKGRDLSVKECRSSPFPCWCSSLDVDLICRDLSFSLCWI